MKNYLSKMCLSQVLKLAVIMLISLNFNTVFSQNSILDKEISITFNNENLETVLSKIETATGYSFSYAPDAIKKNISITKSYTNTTLRQILDETLVAYEIYYQAKGNTILIQNTGKKGQVSGRVITSEGNPAAYVSVTLQGTKLGEATDEKGDFSFSAPEGQYTIAASSMGLKSQKKLVSIVAGSNAKVNFTLTQSAEALKEVIVNGHLKNKYIVKKTDYVARMPLENLENPQVYSTVTSKMFEQQLITNFDDALQKAAGVVSGGSSAGERSSSYLRGFGAQAMFRDGKMLGNWTENDMANIERIEVIKGPSGTLFGGHGRTNYGGIVNRITKKPYKKFGGNISLIGASNEFHRFTADINTPLNKEGTILARVNTAYRKESSFQNFGWAESIFIAPVITYQANDKLKFTLEVDYFDVVGASFTNLNIDKDISNLDELNNLYNLSFTTDEIVSHKKNISFIASAEYKINSAWTSTTSYAASHSDYDKMNTDVYIGDNNMAKRDLTKSTYDIGFTNIQQNFNGDFKIGNMRNRLLVGLDFLRDNEIYSGTSVDDYDTFDITKKAPYLSASRWAYALGEANSTWTSGVLKDRYGIYFSDVLDITPSLHVMTSLRYDYADIKSPDGKLANTLNKKRSYTQGSWTPKLGLTYEVLPKNLSVFGNYMQGTKNRNNLKVDNGTVEGKIVNANPERATQLEFGVKSNLLSDKLALTVSYFDITVEDIVRTDPSATKFELQDGTQQNKGVEFELLAHPVKGLDIMLGYANLDAKFLNGSNEGKRPGFTPENVFSYWFNYKLDKGNVKGLGIGFGGNYREDSYFSSKNLIINSGVNIINTSLSYDQPSYRISLNVDNIGNTKHWGDWLNQQALRTFKGSITFKF